MITIKLLACITVPQQSAPQRIPSYINVPPPHNATAPSGPGPLQFWGFKITLNLSHHTR